MSSLSPPMSASRRTLAVAMEQSAAFLGSIDILVNNAAIQPYGTVASMGSAEWDRVIGINLRGTYLACHHALPHMLKLKRGSIINIASVLPRLPC